MTGWHAWTAGEAGFWRCLSVRVCVWGGASASAVPWTDLMPVSDCSFAADREGCSVWLQNRLGSRVRHPENHLEKSQEFKRSLAFPSSSWALTLHPAPLSSLILHFAPAEP